MIARNFIKFPEALRFQREMFSNGYHNSPRIMRLMECVFDWSATVPDWWKEAKGRARNLAKQVRKSMADFFKETNVIKMVLGFMGAGMTYTLPSTLSKGLYNLPNLYVTSKGQLRCAGTYRRFCPTAFHALGYTDNMNYSNEASDKAPGTAVVAKYSVWVPANFWHDHNDRCPCDNPETDMATEVKTAGNRVLIEGTEKQLTTLKNDAAFYCDKHGPDECPANLKRSALATVAALSGRAAPVRQVTPE